MADKKRPRKPRNLTLNPDGVEKLLAIGAARPVPETNLSRLVDDAIADYVVKHLPPSGTGRSDAGQISGAAEDSARRRTLRKAGR
jgi:hypothetical protein